MVRVDKLIVTWLPIILILLTIYSHEVVVAQPHGSRTEELIIKFYSDIGDAYQALKIGSIDLLYPEISEEFYADAVADSNIVLGGADQRDMYQIDINNNCTVPSYTGIQSPTYGVRGVQFRKALTLLMNKTYVVSDCCNNLVDRIDQPIAYGQKGWRNTSCWYEDGTGIEFNPVQAATILDADGWLQGSTPNPYYDESFAVSSPFLRTYPSDHPQKPGEDLDPLIYCIRLDDIRRYCAGIFHVNTLRKCGIPVNTFTGNSPILYPKVIDNRDYHLYTSGCSLSRFPSMYLYGFFSSIFVEPSWIHIRGYQCDGLLNYPRLDNYLNEARFPSNSDEHKANVRKTLGYGWCELYMTIPLFSSKDFYAWSSDLMGIVNAEVTGPVNDYTLMNAFRESGGSIRIGLAGEPDQMNRFYSEFSSSGSFSGLQCLDRMELHSGFDTQPYDTSIDQAGYILNWTTGTYIDPDDSLEKTVVTQTYRNNTWFVEPVTGNQLEQVNSSHIYASFWMHMYADARAWVSCPCQSDIKTVRIKDSQTIEYYWNDNSYFNTYLGSHSILSFNFLRKGTITRVLSETLTANAVTGFLSCTYEPIFVLSAEQAGTFLTVGVDYDIYRTSSSNCPCGDVRVINETYLGANINITYLAIDDPSGYYPGGLSWQDAFEGAGIYYATDFTPGVGGSLTLERNPYYYMETPPLGEIDFSKKPNGCYKINIFDVVTAATAYGSQGVSEPDFDWFAGADLAPPGGQIDIFDIVTITSNYGTVWDCHQ